MGQEDPRVQGRNRWVVPLGDAPREDAGQDLRVQLQIVDGGSHRAGHVVVQTGGPRDVRQVLVLERRRRRGVSLTGAIADFTRAKVHLRIIGEVVQTDDRRLCQVIHGVPEFARHLGVPLDDGQSGVARPDSADGGTAGGSGECGRRQQMVVVATKSAIPAETAHSARATRVIGPRPLTLRSMLSRTFRARSLLSAGRSGR